MTFSNTYFPSTTLVLLSTHNRKRFQHCGPFLATSGDVPLFTITELCVAKFIQLQLETFLKASVLIGSNPSRRSALLTFLYIE